MGRAAFIGLSGKAEGVAMSLIGPGRPFSQTVVIPQPPEVAQQQLFMSMSGLQGTTPVEVGPGVILVSRRYIPTWAIVLAVIGFFCFLLGLLFLLVRSTETLEIRISVAPDVSGCTIAVNGVADSETVTRLQGLLMSGRPVAGAWAAPYQVPGPGQGSF